MLDRNVPRSMMCAMLRQRNNGSMEEFWMDGIAAEDESVPEEEPCGLWERSYRGEKSSGNPKRIHLFMEDVCSFIRRTVQELAGEIHPEIAVLIKKAQAPVHHENGRLKSKVRCDLTNEEEKMLVSYADDLTVMIKERNKARESDAWHPDELRQSMKRKPYDPYFVHFNGKPKGTFPRENVHAANLRQQDWVRQALIHMGLLDNGSNGNQPEVAENVSAVERAIKECTENIRQRIPEAVLTEILGLLGAKNLRSALRRVMKPPALRKIKNQFPPKHDPVAQVRRNASVIYAAFRHQEEDSLDAA